MTGRQVCNKARSPSLACIHGQATKHTIVKWPIPFAWFQRQTNKIKFLDYYLCFELSMRMLHIHREVMNKSIELF